jgi:multiple antibiotic resistance protein
MVWVDITQLLHAFLVVVGALLPIVNAPGDAPIFLHMTKGCDDATRRTLARLVATYSFALLLGSMILGPLVLRVFELSVAVIQVSGGAVVCALGWKLLNYEGKPCESFLDPREASATAIARAFYPLTMPLTVDPGVIAVAVAVGANHAHTVDRLLIQILAAIVGAGIVALSILVTYRFAKNVSAWVGHSGMMVVLRLSAFIVLSIGVQIGWNGIKALLKEIGVAA